MKKLVLIDGHSILNRAFYGVPELTNSEGLHTNGIYGFLNIMFKVLDEEQADYLAVAFDVSAPTFRHEMYPEYKGTRKPMPGELQEQVPMMKEVLSSMEIPILTKEGFEADDIIGTVAKSAAEAGVDVSVISGDRDLLQLADASILIRIPKTVKGQTTMYDYRPEDVEREYGVTPLEFIDVKALMGDSSDNVPGVPSIGEKTATALIQKYHSIEKAYENVEEVKPPRASKALKEHIEEARFSRALVTIDTKVPLAFDLEEMKLGRLFTPKSLEWIRRMEFKSLYKRFENMDVEAMTASFDYQSTESKEEAWAWVEKLLRSERLGLGLALDALVPQGKSYHENIPVGLCLSTGEKNYLMIPGENLKEGDLLEILEKVLLSPVTKYVLDLKALVKFLKDPLKAKNCLDVSLAAYLLDPLREGYEADQVAREYLHLELLTKKEVLDKKSFREAFAAGEERAFTYLAALGAVPLLAWEPCFKKLQDLEMEKLYREVELPLVYSLAKMEEAGVGVDEKRLRDYALGLQEGIAALEEEIHQKAGESFNINSPKQLGEILFGKLGLPGGRKTKTGYSTSAEVLEKLAPENEIVKDVLNYRQLAKLNSTYATGLAGYIREDGRIHGSFHQTITATGRISSADPNLQNIPIRTEMGSRIRDIFVPKEGYVFVDADYSQIELRILASFSQDQRLIESYRSSADIHTATASQVFHVPIEEVTPALRRNAKAVNFGVVYGISAFGLSEGLSISRKEALDYINNYFKTYPGVKKFLDSQVKKAKEKGFVTTMFGRIRPIPELKSSNFSVRSFGDRVAMNSPIQGSAADIMKIAMNAVDQRLRESGLDARIVLQIHDELLVEVKREEADEVLELVADTMRNAVDLEVPLEVDAHRGETWLEAK